MRNWKKIREKRQQGGLEEMKEKWRREKIVGKCDEER